MEYSIPNDINSTLIMIGATVGLPLLTSDASLSIKTEGKDVTSTSVLPPNLNDNPDRQNMINRDWVRGSQHRKL
jgi:hypothetical protein